ncbi:Histidine kinase-, DNA gyrase B-, and HSP90-like ATPase [Actinacidiphila yanglinensis]|uniref:histidine kinase n=1 Tax=Actinacidiphila yanglinensis TaxID=310779 RepID=A0A1H5SK71_9ACTN|nr:ATP-binding protein [Actinacidiphila yanglinensis]SEF50830.1 Histidine kinase-, DNA gyrase B-, and HSP90-like ATPase [Actinacidiphila yanglinensis]
MPDPSPGSPGSPGNRPNGNRPTGSRLTGRHALPATSALALGAVVACGLACAGLAVGAPQEARTWVQAVAVAYGVLLVAAVTWAGTEARRGRAALARAAAADARTVELRRRVVQSEAYTESHQRRMAQMAAEVDAAGAELAAARAESDRLRERMEELATDATRLVEQAIPEMVDRLGAGATAGTALAAAPALSDARHRRILEVFTGELSNGARLRAATLAACANAAGRVQALTTTMMADLREMENRYDEEVLGDLLRLDHATAQTGRLADSIAVLTGGRSGRRWTKPIVMESILRGAIGRISAYQRVRLHSTSTAAVVGHAAEGVMHALAELVDNATRFSPPTETVHLYVEELTTGVVITVEDAGLVMSPPALRRAQHAVSHDPLRLGTLSGTRLGLAVVGGVAGKYGLTVNFRPSSRGGTGVLLLIPQHLITRPPARVRESGEEREPGHRRGPERGGSRAEERDPAAEPAIGPRGLPMRQGAHAARPARAVPTPSVSARAVPAHAAPADLRAPELPADLRAPELPADLRAPELPAGLRAPAARASGDAVAGGTSRPAGTPVDASAPEQQAGEDVFVLPKRVRGRTLAEADHPMPSQAAAPAARPATGNMGARFGAFVAAGKRQREQAGRTAESGPAAGPVPPAPPQDDAPSP